MRFWMVALGLLGCADFEAPNPARPDAVQEDAEPLQIVFAEARARSFSGDQYWDLEVEVAPGAAPVDRVVMQFFDEAHERCPVERAELFPTYQDGHYALDWHISNDLVDPWHDLYSVVVEVTDLDGNRDLVEVWAEPL